MKLWRRASPGIAFASLRRGCRRSRTLGNVVPQVLAYERHFRLFPCAWFQPCRENVTVFLGDKNDGNVIGKVTQSCCGGCCEPKLNILDKESKPQLVMKGPCVVTDCCGVKFDVHSETGGKIKVAEVKKRGPRNLSDVMKEIATDADEFQIVFLKSDLKVETKATVLVALFIVDLLFFEYGGNANRNLDESCTVDLCVIFCCGWPLPCRVTVNGLGQTGDRRIEGAPEAADMER